MKRFIGMIVFGMLCATGCTTPTLLHSSKTLYETNPMSKVAVFTESTVYYPRWEGMGAIGYTASINAAEKASIVIMRALVEKGYQVVASAPAAVRYPTAGDAGVQWVLDTRADNESWEVPGNIPVYEFADRVPAPEMRQAIRYVFEAEKLSILRKEIKTMVADPQILSYLGSQTGADTVCLLSIWGNTTTGGRKALNAFLGAVANTTVRDDDFMTGRLSCYWAGSGELLWADEIAAMMNPTQAPAGFFKTITRYFPNIGMPVSPEIPLEIIQPQNVISPHPQYPTIASPFAVPTQPETVVAAAPPSSEPAATPEAATPEAAPTDSPAADVPHAPAEATSPSSEETPAAAGDPASVPEKSAPAENIAEQPKSDS